MRCTTGHENAERRRAAMKKDSKWGTPTLEWVRFMREKDVTFSVIGKRLGVSTGRAAQIFNTAEDAHKKHMHAEMHLMPMLRAMCPNVPSDRLADGKQER